MIWSIDLTSTVTLVWFALLVLSFLLVCLYYAWTYWHVGRWHGKKPTTSTVNDNRLPKVSIAIAAHNEAAYLKESLPYLLEQDYPNYEVVVVNYVSQDDTAFVLKVCAENYPYLKAINFPEDVNMFQGKKYPLSIGIKSATGDIIVTMEADCIPHSFSWLREITAPYSNPKVQIVLGYAGVKQENSLLNLMQQYDNLTDSASWLSRAIAGHPYSGTGRNLSYRRDFFFQQGSFIRHYSEPDGADDMFINQNATGRNCAVCLTADSFVQSDAKLSFKLWSQQRYHRFATRRYYSLWQKVIMRSGTFHSLLFYVALTALALLGFPWQYLLLSILLKWCWQIIAFSRLSKRFDVKKIHFFAPLLEIYFMIANTFLYLSTLHRRNIRVK